MTEPEYEHISWILYRTTQLREDLKEANAHSSFKVSGPRIRRIWKDFQGDLVKRFVYKQEGK